MRFGAGEEEAFLVRIGTNGAGEVVVGDAIDDFGPGLAVVGGFVKEGMEVVREIHGRGDVGGAGVEG